MFPPQPCLHRLYETTLQSPSQIRDRGYSSSPSFNPIRPNASLIQEKNAIGRPFLLNVNTPSALFQVKHRDSSISQVRFSLNKLLPCHRSGSNADRPVAPFFLTELLRAPLPLSLENSVNLLPLDYAHHRIARHESRERLLVDHILRPRQSGNLDVSTRLL